MTCPKLLMLMPTDAMSAGGTALPVDPFGEAGVQKRSHSAGSHDLSVVVDAGCGRSQRDRRAVCCIGIAGVHKAPGRLLG